MKYIDEKETIYVMVYNKQNPKRFQTGIIVGTQSEKGIVSILLDSGIDVDVPKEYVHVLQTRRGGVA